MYLFFINVLVVVFFVTYTTKKYGTLLHPVSFLGGSYLMAAVVGPIAYEILSLTDKLSNNAIHYASVLSSLYFIAIGIAFTVRASPFKTLFRWLFRLIPEKAVIAKGSGLSILGLLIQAAFLYFVMMVASGAGLMWITNTREAYSFHRASVGVFWSSCEATLILTFFYVLFAGVRTYKLLFAIAACFSCISLFLGSKGIIVIFFIFALFYGNLCIKKVSNRTAIIAGTLVVVGGLALQLFQGTAKDLVGTLLYFDYFIDSAALIDRIREFHFRFGGLILSDVWYFVPRGLYHAKPYIYGLIEVDELLYPGGAENGFTAGLMPWTLGFGDFGMAGVIIYGLIAGFWSKGAYEFFLERRDAASMMLFAQVGLFSLDVFGNAPFLVFFVWLVFQMYFVAFLSKFQFRFPLRFVVRPKLQD